MSAAIPLTTAQRNFLAKVAASGNEGVTPFGQEWRADKVLLRRELIARLIVPHLGISLGGRVITVRGARALGRSTMGRILSNRRRSTL